MPATAAETVDIPQEVIDAVLKTSAFKYLSAEEQQTAFRADEIREIVQAALPHLSPEMIGQARAGQWTIEGRWAWCVICGLDQVHIADGQDTCATCAGAEC